MVSLGTRLSPSATGVMLLGSGEPAKEALIALRRPGVETIAVDRCDDAPGHPDVGAAGATARQTASTVGPRA
jgi:phosphoribosylglycinamide formyltransferase 2